jgi:hypothetical protein
VPQGWSVLNVRICGRWSILACGISAILFQSYLGILFVYLFVIVAEWSVAVTALVLSIGYDLARPDSKHDV